MKTAFGIALLLFSFAASAVDSVKPLEDADVDIFDSDSVRRGAGFFANYCVGCHSVKQIRYSRIAKDLELSEDTMRREFMFGDVKIHDYFETAMSKADGETPSAWHRRIFLWSCEREGRTGFIAIRKAFIPIPNGRSA